MQRTRSWVLGGILALGLGCAHAKQTGPGQPAASPAETHEAGQAGATAASPGGPPVAAFPKGILKPGSVRKIEEALSQHGFETPASGKLEGRTVEQLSHFQKQQHLAETGLPDRETLRKLGLDPDAIYRGDAK